MGKSAMTKLTNDQIDQLVEAFKTKDAKKSYYLYQSFPRQKSKTDGRGVIEAVGSDYDFVVRLHIILNCKKIDILKSVSDNDFEKFRIAAALSFLVSLKY